MEFNFYGKKALVTGAGKGIGRATAIALAKGGAVVYALSRTQADLESLAKEDPKISCYAIDISDWDATEKVVQGLGPIDLVVNNAGITGSQPTLDVTKETFDSVISTNLRGPLQISQICARTMIDRGTPGSIVNISSISGFLPTRQLASYCASKAGLDMITKSLALELGPHKIRTNSVNPGMVKTQIAEFITSNTKAVEYYLSLAPMGSVKTVEDVVNAVLFLLSDKSARITGVILPVDGGVSMGALNIKL